MFRLFSIFLLVIILVVGGGSYWLCRQALPTQDGVIALPELEKSVKVSFDQSGVPYIQTLTSTDLYLSQGYITASDRLFQMDMLRRMALGELSEVFGAGCIAHDKLMRIIGFNRIAKQELSSLSPEAKNNLKAYCLGVNSYINNNSHPSLEFFLLGYHPKSWQPQDTLAILKFLQYELDESWQLDELRQRVINQGGLKLASKMFEQNFQSQIIQTSLLPNLKNQFKNWGNQTNLSLGSNAWAVAGSMSNSGGAILACDKHTLFTSPNLFYICSLDGPSFHNAGVTIPGVPGIICGRNDNIAWTTASLKADTQDLYVEQFSDKFPDKYRVPGGWANATEITEEIPQRFGSNIIQKISITRHGPVLIKNENTAFSLSWTGLHDDSTLETIFALNKANNWNNFRQILKDYSGSPQIFVYADRQGNIGWQAAGKIPQRQSDSKVNGYFITNGATVLPGWSNNYNWTGFLSFDDLPYHLNNPEGFLVANDPRYSFIPTSNSPVAAQRVAAVLANYKKTADHPDLPEMASLQGDKFAYLNNLIKVEINAALQHTHNIDQYKQQAFAKLAKWNGQIDADSSAACIYESFLSTFLRRILEPKLGLALTNQYVQYWPKWTHFIAYVLQEKPAGLLPPNERTYETFVLDTFGDSLKNLRLAQRTESSQAWAWKNIHKANCQEFPQHLGVTFPFSSIFSPGSFAVGGDQDCVNACNIETKELPWTFLSTAGPTERMVIDMSDQNKFYQSQTLGQSGHVLSNYRFDQLKSWLNTEPHAVAFSDKQIQLQMQHTLILSNRY